MSRKTAQGNKKTKLHRAIHMNLIKSAAIAISAAVVLAPSAFAGQIGSGSSNTFNHESYSGRNWSSGQSQSQETLNGVSVSSSAKSEWLPDAQGHGRVQAQFGTYADSNGTAVGYCNASVGNLDPACISNASKEVSVFGKSTQTNTQFGSAGSFHGYTDSVDASSYTNF
jgi:hypothetical protein